VDKPDEERLLIRKRQATQEILVVVISSERDLPDSVERALLPECGYHVVRWTDCDFENQEKSSDSGIDVFVVEVGGRGTKGLDMVYSLRRDFPMSCVVATGHYSSDCLGRSLAECGADAFVSRQRIASDLADTIRRLLLEDES
jgi:DNA-binding NarL/FixJ family response regulator